MKRGFASDNNAGVHPRIMDAVREANQGHCIAYGEDPWTARALEKMEEVFGAESRSYFVFTGTAANVLSLASLCRPYSAVICPESAHINLDECGAPEHILGVKLVTVRTQDGKLSPNGVGLHLALIGNEHHAQPGMISVTQATEMGTVYRPEEIGDLARLAHEHDLFLHVDGARLSNAAVSLGLSLREISGDLGVDVLSFGGTKNGMMCGEAVVFFNPKLAEGFRYIRKQNTHLASKMRFLAAQFVAYFTDDLWRENALHANAMAARLADGLGHIPGVTIAQKVEANGVFFSASQGTMRALRERFFFYLIDDTVPIGRLMTSFDTTEEDVDGFLDVAASLVGGGRR